MEMIRQRLLRHAVLLLAAVALPGCVSIETGGGRVIYWVVPGSGFTAESGDRTNSAGTKMYDVAVYNRLSIMVRRVVYFSQSSSGTTATDHMGIAIDVVRV